MALYDTRTLIHTAKKIFPVSRWFADRYFPEGTKFPTSKVLIEYKKGGKKMAPFVIPRKGGITMEREGYTATDYEPPYIAPQRPLTIDELNKKGFGEALYANMTPEERQAAVLGEDLAELTEMIDRREEWMCSELLQTGHIIMKHYAEKYGVGTPIEKELRFYNNTFGNVYEPDTLWDASGADIYADLDAMVQSKNEVGIKVTDLNMGAAAWSAFLNNEKIQKLLDNKRINIGNIDPMETPDGVAHMGQIIVRGRKLDIFVYDEQYEAEDGTLKAFFPSNKILLAAPGLGRMLYGSITQIEQEDNQYHTYSEKKVPKYFADSKHDVREIRVASAPVPVPNDLDGWMVATVTQ